MRLCAAAHLAAITPPQISDAAFSGLPDDTARYRGYLTAQDIAHLATGSVTNLGDLTVSQRLNLEP